MSLIPRVGLVFLMSISSIPMMHGMHQTNGSSDFTHHANSPFAPYFQRRVVSNTFHVSPYTSPPLKRKKITAKKALEVYNPNQSSVNQATPFSENAASTCQQVGAVLAGSAIFFLILTASCYTYPH